MRRTAKQRREANSALDGWVLGQVAQTARRSAPDEVTAFSAFLSEVAGDPYLAKMPYARAVKTRKATKAGGRET